MAIITQKRVSGDSYGVSDPNFVKDNFSGDFPKVDNSQPEMSIQHLLPLAIAPLSLIRLKGDERGDSNKILADALKIGFDVQHYELPLYGRSKQGRTRYHSNSELVQGYPFYGLSSDPLPARLTKLAKARQEMIGMNALIKKKAEAFSDPVKFDEWDDADKITIQRTQYYGRFLALSASTDLIDLSYPKRFLEIVSLVCQHYVQLTEGAMPKRSDVMSLITDARETSVGGPSFSNAGVDQNGRGYHEKRMITLFDMPVPDYSLEPLTFLSDVYQWGEQLGLPDGSMAFASAIAYRQGAKGHKPQKLWYHDGSGFVADFEAMSWESNQRLVYPAPHALNVTLTPAVYQMKLARKRKLGMFHSPELVSAYIPRLNQQGSISYESDFSSFDTTISNVLLQYIFKEFARFSTKYSWEYELFAEFISTTGVISPNFLTEESMMVTYFKNAVSLLSGILPTSESGSVVSIAANLFALEDQIPTIVPDWLGNKFVILVQSDDVLFTLPKKLDEERFAAQMKRLRLTAKLKEGNMFLKKLLPVGSLAKYKDKFPLGGVPLWSRQTQQTFFNEHSYEGKPDAIVRLALLSRAEGVNAHPIFDKQLDSAWKDILSSYPIFSPIIDVLYQGVLALPEADKQEVIRYSSTDEGLAWMSQIYNRAESDPKAKQTLTELEKLGFSLSQYEDTAVSQRQAYLHAMYSSPSSDSRTAMSSILSWTGMGG